VRHTGRARDDTPVEHAADTADAGNTGEGTATAGDHAGGARVAVAVGEPAATESGARPATVDGVGARLAAVDPRRMSTRAVAAVVVLLTAVMLLVSYAGKARCVGPTFDDKGRTTPDYDIRMDRDLCYSDIQYLWLITATGAAVGRSSSGRIVRPSRAVTPSTW
jgi:hypothetical protein